MQWIFVILLSLFVARVFMRTCSSVEMLKREMVSERLGPTGLESHRRHPRIRKIAIDPMSLKKVPLHLKILRKMQIFDFPEAIFWQFSEKFKKVFSRFPGSFFETVFSLGVRLKTPTNNKFQPKWAITVFFGKKFWVKKLVGWCNFRIKRHWGLRKNARKKFVSFFFQKKLG